MRKNKGQTFFRVHIQMEVEMWADNQAKAHDQCRYVLDLMEDAARVGQQNEVFTKIGLATAHATVQGHGED